MKMLSIVSAWLEKLPAWLPVAIVIVSALGAAAILIHKDGEAKGGISAELHPINTQLKKLPAKIAIAAKATDIDRKAADQAHRKSSVTVERALELQRQAHELSDSALAGVPAIVLTASAASATAMMDIVSENHSLWQYIADDSTKDVAMQLQDSLQSKKIELLEKESHPLCGQKCGMVLGGGLVALIVFLTGR